MKKKIMNTVIIAMMMSFAVSGCSKSTQPDTSAETAEAVTETATTEIHSVQTEVSTAAAAAETVSSSTQLIDNSDLFTERDLEQTADTANAETITAVDGKTVEITKEGVYVLSGTAKNFTVKVNADGAKVQLVLDGANITNDDFPVIYVVSADKCFVTTTDKESSLSVTGTFKADGETNTDAVIYSKDDLVLNGTGTLNITSANGNGVTSKDDLKATGGTYNITSALDSIEANDSIRISGGTFNITSAKDGLHSEDSDDDTKGYIYISGGSFTINAKSDAIRGTSAVQIDGGTFDLTASEGIEGTYVQINDGTISVNASDDGINAPNKSSAYSTPTIEFNGGTTTIVMGAGDTDAVDANGNIIVNGGKIDITAQTSSFDYDGKAEFNGGTIIINGTEVSEIPQSMMGGRGGFGGGRQNFGSGEMPNFENGEMPNFENGEMPNFGNGEMPNFENGEMPNFGNGEMPNFENGERPNFGNGEMPNFENGEMPNFENGERPNFGRGERGGRGGFTQGTTATSTVG